MNYNFNGKNVVVTGGGTGLGKVIATLFAGCGANVSVLDLGFSESAIAELTTLGINQYVADVTNTAQLTDIFNQISPIDVLINNASIYPVADFVDMTAEQWKQMVDIDLNSVFYCTSIASKLMIKSNTHGNIINITTIDALHPSSGHSHYCSAKAGVVSLTKSTAHELGKYGIRVNAVAPGLVNRPDLKTSWPDGYNRFLSRSAIDKVPEPQDVAYACMFLASNYASAITGVELPVDSGVLTAAPY